MPFAVRRLARALPRSIDRGDLTGIGHLALVRAADSYVPGRLRGGFAIWANYKIRQAMLDAYRKPGERQSGRDYLYELHEPLPDGHDEAHAAIPVLDDLLAYRQKRALVMRKIVRLSNRQRALLADALKGKTVEHSAKRLGLTYWHTSRLRTAAVLRMREAIAVS